ncbi:MAG: hypothetical protein A3205_05445 [Methanomassiliicoccales archaeon Mx-03]|nr:MAG: hypothetical protein A3205_05445 [Methanomassiliicoccales archaeon Mx-03]
MKPKLGGMVRGIRTRFRLSDGPLSRIRPEELSEDADETEVVINHYIRYRYTRILFLLGFVVLAVVLAGIAMGVGAYNLTISEVYSIIFDRLTDWGPLETNAERVVWNSRLPRVLTAVFVGVGLAIAGAAMQSMMKNPLADPYTTGISSGAAFGATLAITMGIQLGTGYEGRIINAFVFSLIPALVIVLLSKFRKPTPAMIILVGISIMYILNAFQSYMMLYADPNATAAVYAWTIGSLSQTNWDTLPFVAVIVIVCAFAIQFMTRTLNTMNSGDSYAKSLGINVDVVRIVILLLISVIAAGVVSFTGIIGFIGLVAPHIARMFVGSDNRVLIPAAAIMGACFVLFSDILARTIASTELPIGIITSMIGGPIFLLLIISQKKEVW